MIGQKLTNTIDITTIVLYLVDKLGVIKLEKLKLDLKYISNQLFYLKENNKDNITKK